MPIPGNLLTTAMAVMPHSDPGRALDLALSLDVPFWPQLPNLSYHEDMYVQAAEHFPGAVVDFAQRRLRFSQERFLAELEDTLARFDDPTVFDVSPAYSQVYERFLGLDLADRPAIRGQLEGPVSFGLNVCDDADRPIIYDDTVRPFMLEFMARRVNVQLARLRACNPNAFMFVDEPGLQFVFSAVSGYSDVAARADLETFLALTHRPRGIHLCGNPDWDFLLGLDLDVVSMDAHTNGEVLAAYAGTLQRYLDRGGSIVWGIVPTNVEPFGRESQTTLVARLDALWAAVTRRGVDRDLLFSRSMLSPATCCLVNPDVTVTVERAFAAVRALSAHLREVHHLDGAAAPGGGGAA